MNKETAKIQVFEHIGLFIDANQNYILDNSLQHFQLIAQFEMIFAGKAKYSKAFNITNDRDGLIMGLWLDGSFQLYGRNFSDDMIRLLAENIPVVKFTPRFSFSGNKDLIVKTV